MAGARKPADAFSFLSSSLVFPFVFACQTSGGRTQRGAQLFGVATQATIGGGIHAGHLKMSQVRRPARQSRTSQQSTSALRPVPEFPANEATVNSSASTNPAADPPRRQSLNLQRPPQHDPPRAPRAMLAGASRSNESSLQSSPASGIIPARARPIVRPTAQSRLRNTSANAPRAGLPSVRPPGSGVTATNPSNSKAVLPHPPTRSGRSQPKSSAPLPKGKQIPPTLPVGPRAAARPKPAAFVPRHRPRPPSRQASIQSVSSRRPSIASSDRTGSSGRLSQAVKDTVSARDRYKCIICGRIPLNISHIVARSPRSNFQVYWLWSTNIDPEFRKDRASNLLSLCAVDNNAYDTYQWTLVPTQSFLQKLLEHEKQDWDTRVAAFAEDPPRIVARTVPTGHEVAGWYEYLPLHPQDGRVGNHYISVERDRQLPSWIKITPVPSRHHIRTRMKDNGAIEFFLRDLDPYALIASACEAMSGPYYPLSKRVRQVEPLVTKLRNLYNRHPAVDEHGVVQHEHLPPSSPMPDLDDDEEAGYHDGLESAITEASEDPETTPSKGRKASSASSANTSKNKGN